MFSLDASPSFSAAAIPVVYVPTTTCGGGGVDKIYEEERSIHRTKIYEPRHVQEDIGCGSGSERSTLHGTNVHKKKNEEEF